MHAARGGADDRDGPEDLGRAALHVRAERDADAAHRLFADGDGERRLRQLGGDEVEEGVRVGQRVGVREAIAQVQPDRAIVGVAREGGGIGAPPRTHLARVEDEAHGC
jgi:hypothetical protein